MRPTARDPKKKTQGIRMMIRTQARKASAWVSAVTILLLIPACGAGMGQPCEIVGSGFTASHDCRYKCLSLTNVLCPDGNRLKPKLCTGPLQCQPGTCPNGSVCYAVDDPFDEVSYCVPETTCPGVNQDELNSWERRSFERATQTRQNTAR